MCEVSESNSKETGQTFFLLSCDETSSRGTNFELLDYIIKMSFFRIIKIYNDPIASIYLVIQRTLLKMMFLGHPEDAYKFLSSCIVILYRPPGVFTPGTPGEERRSLHTPKNIVEQYKFACGASIPTELTSWGRSELFYNTYKGNRLEASWVFGAVHQWKPDDSKNRISPKYHGVQCSLIPYK